MNSIHQDQIAHIRKRIAVYEERLKILKGHTYPDPFTLQNVLEQQFQCEEGILTQQTYLQELEEDIRYQEERKRLALEEIEKLQEGVIKKLKSLQNHRDELVKKRANALYSEWVTCLNEDKRIGIFSNIKSFIQTTA
jgi:hypothetical protein